MTAGNDSATGFSIPGSDRHGWAPESIPGLTKREYFAAMAMQGIISAHNIYQDGIDHQVNAKAAVNAANALIKALNENE